MDEEGHLKIADFGSAVENMWPGEKIQEDWVTGTPSFMAPEVSLMTSLTSNKMLHITAFDLGYWMIADKYKLSCILVSVSRVSHYASTRTHEHISTRANELKGTCTRAHEHTSTRVHQHMSPRALEHIRT